MKLAVIGGGSTYTPELLNGILDPNTSTPITEVVLYDVAPERLGPVVDFCQRLAEARGSDVPVHSAATLDEALRGASFVVAQIRVGGQAGRHDDIMMGLRYGLIGQETTGVGGMAKALRTIPAMLEIAERAKELCPDAWILNFTNPSGIVTEALHRAGHTQVVGLCNVPIEMHMDIAKVLGADVADVDLDWVGLNHLGWVRRVLHEGRDVLPELLDRIEEGVDGPANLPEIDYPRGFLRALGMIPSSYMRFFYMPDAMYEATLSKPRTRAQEVLDIEAQLFALYRDPEVRSLPELLSERGGAWYSRLAVEVMQALANDEPTVHIVNVPNAGTIAGLPKDAVVEVPCTISRDGVTPIEQPPIEDEVMGLIRQVKAYERLTIDAATGDRGKALLALMANPLVPDARTAERVLASMVERGLI